MSASKWYDDEDLTCHCGCGISNVQPELIDMLDDMCDKYGCKLEVSCTYRCPEHNADVGGVPNSDHTKGMAADVLLPEDGSLDCDSLAELARSCGANAIGLYPSSEFVHCGIREYDAEWTEDDV